MQQDGLVLSEAEQRLIMDRIDAFNRTILEMPERFGGRVRVIDVGRALNDALAGTEPVAVGGRVLSRKWGRAAVLTAAPVAGNEVGPGNFPTDCSDWVLPWPHSARRRPIE